MRESDNMAPRRTTFGWIRRYLSWTLLLIVGGVLYVLVFNENSYERKIELNNRISALEDSIKSTTDTLMYYRDLNAHIDTDPATMERVVREEFHMVRPNEDVYIFTDD